MALTVVQRQAAPLTKVSESNLANITPSCVPPIYFSNGQHLSSDRHILIVKPLRPMPEQSVRRIIVPPVSYTHLDVYKRQFREFMFEDGAGRD